MAALRQNRQPFQETPQMATDFFNEDMRLFVDHRVDWERYFRWKRGADVPTGSRAMPGAPGGA